MTREQENKPAPAQDERLRAAFMEGYQQGIDSEFSDSEAAWNRSRTIHLALDLEQARPAQTEQQPEQSALVLPRAQLERIERRLTDWLELNCCECESGHLCGRNEVTADRDAIRAALSAPIAQTAPQQSDDSLIANAKALLALDERGSLAPHGIGGLAREVIEKLVARVEQTAPQPEQVEPALVQDEREAFEAWMVEVEGARIRPRFDRVTAGPFADEYRDGQIQGAWNVWQASAARRRGSAGRLCT